MEQPQRRIVTMLKFPEAPWTQYRSDDFPDVCAIEACVPECGYVVQDIGAIVEWVVDAGMHESVLWKHLMRQHGHN